ncbi:hypothetical protein, partial [Rodentibacter pneumotropicus]
MWLLFDLNKNNRKEIKKEILNYLGKNKVIPLKNLEEVTEKGEILPNLDKDFNAEIRIWLPNILYQYITENGYSVANSIREILIEHCYGKIAVQQMRRKYFDKNYERKIKFPTSENKVNLEMPILGKKNIPSKIACHKKLKNDLEKLANLNNCTLSEYI